MKIIIAGSRGFDPYGISDLVWGLISHCIERLLVENDPKGRVTEIVSGGAKGADKFGEVYAKANNIPVKVFLPDYINASNPVRAPLIRNVQMSEYADALIVIWGGKSRGTRHMMDCMKRAGKPIETIYI